MLLRLLLVTVLVALASGCATSYQRRGFTGGYSDARIDGNTFRVSFIGNGYTSRERVETAALYRAAELTREMGFDSFVIVAGNVDAAQFHWQMPGSYRATTTGSANVVGGVAIGSATTVGTYTPGPTIPIRKYQASIVFRAFHGPKPASGFDAREVLRYVGPQLGRTPDVAATPPVAPVVEQSADSQAPGATAAVTPPSAASSPVEANALAGTFTGTASGTARGRAFTIALRLSLVQSGDRLTGTWTTSAGASGTVSGVVDGDRITDLRAIQVGQCPGEFIGGGNVEARAGQLRGYYAGSDCGGPLAATFVVMRAP